MTARGPALSSHTLMDPTATGRHPRVRTRQSIHHVVNGLALIDRVGLLASDVHVDEAHRGSTSGPMQLGPPGVRARPGTSAPSWTRSVVVPLWTRSVRLLT
jgi:hypothetical protein